MLTCVKEKSKAIHILLVEDNPGDVRLVREIFKEGKVDNTLHVAQDGLEAMAFLRGQGEYAEAPCPDIILLDLNLPKKNGLEVLAEIKSDDALKIIPVIILTSSKADEDIVKSHALHANCYITKPIELEKFIKAVQSIEDFWLTVAALPRGQKLRK